MGFDFAHLLVYSQSLRPSSALMDSNTFLDMIRRARSAIHTAIATTDTRTTHLTDHIYHMVTFSALTLCRLVHTYEPQLLSSEGDIDIDSLDALVAKVVVWLRSIGMPGQHAAYLLSSAVAAQFRKLRPQAAVYALSDTAAGSSDASLSTSSTMVTPQYQDAMAGMEVQGIPDDLSFLYLGFTGPDLFSMNNTAWPEWGPE